MLIAVPKFISIAENEDSEDTHTDGKDTWAEDTSVFHNLLDRLEESRVKQPTEAFTRARRLHHPVH